MQTKFLIALIGFSELPALPWRSAGSRAAATLGSFFFGDLPADDKQGSVEERETRERMERPETIELVRLYYAITDLKVRQSFLDMVKSVAESGKRRG